MELDAVGRMIAMLHSHDLRSIPLAVGAHGGDDQRGGERGGIDDERVVAHRRKRAGNPIEQLVVAVHDGTGLAVHQPWRADDLPAERLADRLMARQTPRIGTCPASARTRGTRMPAWAGVLGPGESTAAVGFSACTSETLSASFR